MKKILLFILAVMLLLPCLGLGETVATSFYPIWLLARNLTEGIEGIEVVNLAAPDTGCLHDYQLQTRDMKTLSEADLFLINGAGMESYLETVFSALPELPVISAAEGIPLLYGLDALEIGEHEPEAEQEEEKEEAHDHIQGSAPNAHIWLSAANAAAMAGNLARGMAERMPQHAEALEANLARMTERLTALDAQLKEGLAELPRKQIITFHEAFPYFAQAYGLEVAAVVNREPGETLTPAQMAELIEAVRALGNPPLFVEPQYEDLSARILAAETGAPVYTLDPVVTGPEENPPADYYEQVMLENMRVLQEALGQ